MPRMPGTLHGVSGNGFREGRGKLDARDYLPATLSARRRNCTPARRFSRERFFGVRVSDLTTREWRLSRRRLHFNFHPYLRRAIADAAITAIAGRARLR